MYLALSTYVLVISLMQSLNGTQFLNIAVLFVLILIGAIAVPVFGIVIVPLRCMYACIRAVSL